MIGEVMPVCIVKKEVRGRKVVQKLGNFGKPRRAQPVGNILFAVWAKI